MMYVLAALNVVADYLSFCVSLTTTLSVRFKVDMLVAAQNDFISRFEGNKEVIINVEARSGSRNEKFQIHSVTASARSSVCNVPRPSPNRTDKDLRSH